MNKSFKQRLEALEALEEQAEQARAPLSDEDRDLLYLAIESRSVTMDANRQLVRSWATGDTSTLDLALVRCNTALAALLPPLATLEDIDAWIRELPELDSFDDDELLVEIFMGLLKGEKTDPSLGFARGSLHVVEGPSVALRRYWAGIAARGAPLVKERGITFFPLLPSDIRAAIERMDAGMVTCQPVPEYAAKSHQHTVTSTRPVNTNSKRHSLLQRLVWALDQYMYQTDCMPIETTEELRADLVAALEQFDHETIDQETA
jgi:hypothetical protein